jgi:peptidyl-prolyl cis-trans isomerase SurA
VQRIGERQADVSDENRRAQVRETIGQRKLEEQWNSYQRDMRNEAYVDIRADDTPPAATGATPPAASAPAPAAPTPPAPPSGG